MFQDQEIKRTDWVFCSWRSHYKCLLKGVPPDEVKQKILDGKSISLNFPDHRIFSSAIVGGNLPIAVGTALSIKRNSGSDRVFCFLGDMTAESGIFAECLKYSTRHQLPIHYIIEDNGVSVCTSTQKVWGNEGGRNFCEYMNPMYVTYFTYKSKWKHAGTNKRIQF